MADQSAIEWTDATWNPVTGCSKVSPGCAHCYAETFANRGLGRFRGSRDFEDVQCHEDALDIPRHWKRPRRIFVNSMSDLFHEAVPDDFLHRVYHAMEHARWHTFQVLTKRADRMRDYLDWRYGEGRIPSRHIWHGVSVENQHWADVRVPLLLQTRSAVRFISAEPLLGLVNFDGLWGYPGSAESEQLARWPIHWVIVGGESGPGARPFNLAWARSIVQQCQAAGVACFMKQLGADPVQRLMYGPATFEADQPIHYEPIRLSSRKGGDPSEWPEDLRVREFPTGRRGVIRCD
jgi:protein gp37